MSEDLQIVSVIGANGQSLPLQGNSLGSDWSIPVKQERADDAEIREMAAKIKESQKDILAKQQQQAAQLANRQALQAANGGIHPPLTNGNGQTNILNFLSRQPKATMNGNVNIIGNHAALTNGTSGRLNANGSLHNGTDDGRKEKLPCDDESLKGHFGWAQFGKACIPYIYRQQEKYCSVRVLEMKLLGKYLNCLHPDIYSSCTCVCSYYITEAEARLFIEINHKHCDGEFGRDVFTQKDLVVRLCDASKFYQFLEICYRKLVSGSKTASEKCGFIRINKESVVPYTVRNGSQVVPLFYFEGETENLKIKAEKLQGWDLAYLKFCCKVQGIRNELFSSESVAVISLTDIKSYFPNGTEFEDYWPSKVVDSNLLIGNRANVNSSVNWTRHPPAPPPKTVMPNSSGNQKTQHSTVSAAAVAAQQQQLIKQRAAAAAGHGSAAANAFNQQSAAAAAAAAASGQRMLTQATVQALTNGAWMQSQGNLPMLHAQMLAQQTHAANANRVQYRNPMENLILGSNRQPYPYNNANAISMASTANNHNQANAPPPLVRSAAGQNMSTNDEQTMLQQQLQTQHQPPHQQQSQQQHQLQQQQQQQQQQRHIHLTNVNPNSKSASATFSAAASLSSPSYDTSFTCAKQKTHSKNNYTPAANVNAANAISNSSAASAATTLSAAATTAAATNINALLDSPFNFNLPSTPADYTNLAFWSQLTATQRLLLTQQMKNGNTLLGNSSAQHASNISSSSGSIPNACNRGSSSSSNNNNSSTQKSCADAAANVFPMLPLLPFDTDLITMLDYNKSKSAHHSSGGGGGNSKIFGSNASAATCSGGGGGGGVSFTKPNAPPEPDQSPNSGSVGSGGGKRRMATSMPLNSTLALEDFEKKFKMTDEMRAVVQKVLSNPDLSTFIQTNASNTFVPFISPPISPAIGGGPSPNTTTTLSLVSNPNVTITPQLPAHFLHSPSSSSSSGASTTASPLGGAAAGRQKSVICSTKTALPTPTHSSASPSPTRSLIAGAQYHKHCAASVSVSTSSSYNTSSSAPSIVSSASSYCNRQQQRVSNQHSQHQQHQINLNHHNNNNNNTNNNNHNNNHNHNNNNHQNIPPMEVIDLSSSRRSLQGASDYLIQQQAAAAVTQKRMQQAQQQAAAQQQQQQQNGRSTIIDRVINSTSASMHLQRHAASAAAAAAAGENARAQRLSIIPEIPTNNMNVHPYKVQKVFVDKHLVPCINMKAYNDADQLMTLTDFEKYFFPTVPLDHCKRLIEALGVELYKGNRHQIQILMDNDRTYNENIPLVQVRDIMKYMTQLTFMTRNPEQPPAKRTRAS